MITGVLHAGFTVRDADRSIAFYRDALGFELWRERVVDAPWLEQVLGLPGARVRIVHLNGHGQRLELLEYQEPRGAGRARGFEDVGSAHLCFTSDDIDADWHRLLDAGAEAINPPQVLTDGPNAGGRVVYVRDPDGNAVELHQLARPWGE